MSESLSKIPLTVVVATGNINKIYEIDAITKKYGIKVISPRDAGIPENFDVVEDGDTFEENSLIKAKAFMNYTKLPSIADDSGLSVDYLNGDPGVHSARYANTEGIDQDRKNREKLLLNLKDVPYEKRTGAFVSAITLIFPEGKYIIARGEVKGHIAFQEMGERGFGYDSLFIPEGFDKTFSQMTAEEKNEISHRANALKELAQLLEEQGYEKEY